ncbi:cationic amino acid transporter 2-like [Adelges cooleyi]|uniref:cationic amino acid transporter 2-like n=1 Tax=Adelges cooleyi TaxID=133065 RepID=UPI0021801CD7|nr:cationic amino acid transporter 2-like [Adelges cooleyi]
MVTTTRQNIPLGKILSRKKNYTAQDEPGPEKLKRVLNLFDLTLLASGGTLGAGVYILAGVVGKTHAGPAVVLSFVLAAAVSSFAGLCYAEFASRVPKSGSAYIYTYVAVGEFPAFIIGWNLILEHVIGVASIGKATSNYFDFLLGYPQKNFMVEHFPIHISFLGEYPDVASLVFILLVTGVVAWGVRESTAINNIFTTLNFLTIVSVVVTGWFYVDIYNWNIPKSAIPAGVNGGEGGFLPFGWSGMIAGAAKCLYGFIGFDTITTIGDETKNPKRTIPLAIVISLACITTVYCAVAVVMTMMWPYYDQDPFAPLPAIYEHLGVPYIQYMVTVGAISALATTLIGAIFPLPRILYAMASDGLLFKVLSTVNSYTKTPLVSTMLCGTVSGLMSSIFNLDQLIAMASIGTFQAYTVVCICVLLLRYETDNKTTEAVETSKKKECSKWYTVFNEKIPNRYTQSLSVSLTFVYVGAATVFSICLVNLQYCESEIICCALIFLCVVSAAFIIVPMVMLYRLPQMTDNIPFKVPFVPVIPCVSILLNIYMMMALDYITWIRFLVWIVLGLVIYFFYGINNSLEAKRRKPHTDQQLQTSLN